MSLIEDCSSDMLVSRAKSEDGAFTEIVRRYRTRIRAQICSVARLEDSDVDDLLQLIFLTVYEQLDKFDRSKGSFSNWIHTIAKNETWDMLRRRSSQYRRIKNKAEFDSCLSDYRQQQSNQQATSGYLAGELLSCLAEYNEDYHAALRSHYLLGLKQKEIAETDCLSPNTVQSRVFRGLRYLRKIVAEDAARNQDLSTTV